MGRERGSALIISVIVMLVIAVIGVGMVRFSAREVAGATAGGRAEALSACAAAAERLLTSRFHALGQQATEVTVLNVLLDGDPDPTHVFGRDPRVRAVGGHIDGDPSQPLVTVKQVEPLPSAALAPGTVGDDLTNTIVAINGLGGTPLKVTVHCQEGDLSSNTSGRQLEIELGVRFGL